jgi:iron complex outermembrane recepter protein
VNIRALTGLNLLLLAATAPVAAAEADDQLQEITVTATRRSENLQNVASSATVFSGSDMVKLGVMEPRDLAEQTPGLLTKFGPNGLATTGFYIRGVGINDFTGTVDPSVGIYVDEVYMPTPDMLNFAVFDMERVEVLRGPQGTLYGRNSTAGAINFITAKPTHDVEGYVRAGWGSWGTTTAEGALSGPLTDQLLGRISFSGQWAPRDRGYSLNEFDGSHLGLKDDIAVRGQLQWLPSDDFNIRLSYTYGDKRDDQPLLQHIGSRNPNNLNQVCGPVQAGYRSEGHCVDLLGYSENYSNPYTGNSDLDPFLEMHTSDVAITTQWKMSHATLTSVTAYDDFATRQNQDIDASPNVAADNRTRNRVENFSEEVRLTSDDSSPFKWIAGADFAHTLVNWFQTIDLTQLIDLPSSNGANQSTRTAAAFGQLIYSFNEEWEVTGGLRYTNERRAWQGATFVGTFPNLASAFASGAPILSEIPVPVTSSYYGTPLAYPDTMTDSKIDYQAVLKYKPTDNMMYYISTARAFRSGGYSSAVIFSQDALAPYGPETLTSYEAGMKLTLPEAHLRFDTSAFFYDFQNFQATFVRSSEANARLQNAGTVHTRGLESSIEWFPIRRFTANVGLSLLHAEIVSSDVVLAPLNGGPPSTIAGNEVPNAPHYTVNALLRYDAPLPGDYKLGLQTDAVKVGAHYLEPNNRAVLRENGYYLLNGRISFSPANGPWEVAAWGRNLTNQTYMSSAQDLIQSLGFAEVVLGQPRTWGLSVEYRF